MGTSASDAIATESRRFGERSAGGFICLAMDPYLTLGVPRGSTLDEVKEAFRSRVQHAHPDRGGEDVTFIRLRAAYEQILAELDRSPGPIADMPARASRRDRPPIPPDARVARSTYIDWLQRVSTNSMHRERRRRRWFHTIGKLALLSLFVFGIIILFWNPFEYDREAALAAALADEAARKAARNDVTPKRSGDGRLIPVATSPRAVDTRVPPVGRPLDVFVIPYDSTLYLTPMGGSAGGVTEFGLGASLAVRLPIFSKLPHSPEPSHEVTVGYVARGLRLGIYLRTNESWVFSESGASREAVETFMDRDNSLGRNGSILEKTGQTTWILHLDDVGSGDDDDDDVLIQIRLVPVVATVPVPKPEFPIPLRSDSDQAEWLQKMFQRLP
jgi:DnaJ domain